MTFTSYDDLKTAIATWLARSDLTDNIPDFITLFEASAARRLRVRPMETTATLTPSSGSAPLPSDFLGVRRLTWTGDPNAELTYTHPSYLRSLYPSSDEGTPSHYSIEASNIVIRPTSDTNLELLYYAKTAAVSSSLGWLFNNHPDAYLFGSLAEAEGFNIDPDKMAMWITRRDAVFDEIKLQEFRERGQMAVRVVGATP